MGDEIVFTSRWCFFGSLSNRTKTGVLCEDIKDIEFSWPIGMPLVHPLGQELWEVNSSLPGGRLARALRGLFYMCGT